MRTGISVAQTAISGPALPGGGVDCRVSRYDTADPLRGRAYLYQHGGEEYPHG